MTKITIDGVDFEINRLSREKYSPTYILSISISNHNEVDIPNHERKRILDCGYRRDITDDLLRDEIGQFQEKHPNADINGFSVIEEYPAREATRVDL